MIKNLSYHFRSFVQPLTASLIFALTILFLSAFFTVSEKMGPILIWINFLFAFSLLLPTLFQEDFKSGFLTHCLLNLSFLKSYMFGRLVHFALASLMLAFVAATIGAFFFHLSLFILLKLYIALFLSNIILTLFGALIHTLLLLAKNASLLSIILMVPLFFPVAIFTISYVQDSTSLWGGASFYFLLGIAFFALSLAPMLILKTLKLVLQDRI